VDPADYKYATFAPLAGSAFEVRHEGKPVMVIQLVSVTAGPKSDRVDQFSLLFHGPAKPILAQQTVQVHHDVIGDLSLFLVPLGVDGDAVRYESIFSRLK
jgi:hypothetical protein